MKINPTKSKAICFTRARVTEPLNYSLGGTVIPEASSCKYLGIILRSDLSWSDQVNYTVKRAWKALHFTMREGQINALDRVQKKAAKFAHHRNESNWETFTERRKIARICSFFKAYTGEWAWKTIGGRLETPCYLSRGDHGKKIRSRKQRTDIVKYSFVNRTIQLWNQLPADALGILSCKPSNFRQRVRKLLNEAK
ncbi:hypothetical protein B7P43_G13462 [Cryptotermes secundus]|uniref:Reverse transcriptase domain-containing protein n=1 Tax=Cryptotermes secundus TaxID=105785 RepID=A0A2J7RBJ0_9NEOP|nr:hypothetical protein B7P43_G13462 [Cryptotermes secundus]